jgi:hypothetical protein
VRGEGSVRRDMIAFTLTLTCIPPTMPCPCHVILFHIMTYCHPILSYPVLFWLILLHWEVKSSSLSVSVFSSHVCSTRLLLCCFSPLHPSFLPSTPPHFTPSILIPVPSPLFPFPLVFEKSPRMANRKIEETRAIVNGKW